MDALISDIQQVRFCVQVGRVEQIETAAQAKARRGPKAKILRQLTRIHTPATATGAHNPLHCDLLLCSSTCPGCTLSCDSSHSLA